MDSAKIQIAKVFFNKRGSFFVAASMACYILSFALPTYYEPPTEHFTGESHLGWEIFLISAWPGTSCFAKDARIFVSWFANVMWCIGVILYLQNMKLPSVVMTIIGVVLASLFLFDGAYLIGYYVWALSMYLLAAGCILQARYS